ncbi:WD40-like Beta Propeller Repeat [Prevotella sp. ne3005]|uniref:TolB family protein n=1 Tax=Prevotella sp. ne3005 TaxID=1761887 RepID=UPI0008D7BCD2|nr:PD40 domain-containing protein [Prevotella sp. ne3005]SEM89685.1 WD40-like Beta Propeller Repeat [Prevotella sp. ne3005]
MICLSFIIYHLSFCIACSHAPKDVVELDTLPPIYPDYCNVTIPENIAPLNFLLRADCEAIEVKAGELVLNASGNEAVFNMDDWKTLMQQSSGKEIEVTITALVNGTWKQYKSFRWQVVGDRVDPYLTYRLIEPDYEIWNHVQIQQRCVENFEVNALGHYEQLENRCMNCHTYANQNPRLSMMYVRGPGGGAILNSNSELQKLNIPGSVYFGFSPTGRYITYSTQKIIPAFHSLASKRLEVYDAASNVFVADMQEHRVISSPLLSDSLKFETFPTFSPDGKYIYYCTADTVSLPRDIKNLQYSLVRIPFDETTGTIGTQVDTLFSQRSVCHPRISPDGRYLLYTVADYGTFPIWHPEADLQMMNLQTGAIDSLSIVNSEKSDTYHSWSSNSRWFVFASKRDDGLYGKPYFCYVDSHGKAHKPFCLPQQHPTFYDNNLKSFNAPELGKGKVPFDVYDVAKAMKQEPIKFY